ncbi:pyridoxal-phosphate dependent enzyme [Salinactinospora qingdaonensis]|uniref:S-sulfocysteine synthase CysK2 n=1 Tax=Salinactinospora qingdaonensis TaxID=702744 RepID=A0ABP7GGM8_9ACTN
MTTALAHPTSIAADGAAPELLPLLENTPIARVTAPLPYPHPGFWAKLEYLGAGGMKARAAVSMLLGARHRGELAPGAPVVESTSGTLGIGMAFAGRALGHPIVLVVDRELETSMRSLLLAYGARLEVVTEPHPVGGWQRARLERVHEICRGLSGAYWPNQYNNPDNPAGYAPLARELVDQVGHADILVCSVGSGGHGSGIARLLRSHWPGLHVIGVDTVGSTIFGLAPRPRLMRGLGSSIYPRNVDYTQFDEVHWLGPAEAVHACRELSRRSFVTGGWSTGAVATVAAWAARMRPGAEVVTVFPDGPHRYLESIFDDDYCQRHGLLSGAASRPVEVAFGEVDEVAGWARCRTVRDPLSHTRAEAGDAG